MKLQFCNCLGVRHIWTGGKANYSSFYVSQPDRPAMVCHERLPFKICQGLTREHQQQWQNR